MKKKLFVGIIFTIFCCILIAENQITPEIRYFPHKWTKFYNQIYKQMDTYLKPFNPIPNDAESDPLELSGENGFSFLIVPHMRMKGHCNEKGIVNFYQLDNKENFKYLFTVEFKAYPTVSKMKFEQKDIIIVGDMRKKYLFKLINNSFIKVFEYDCSNSEYCDDYGYSFSFVGVKSNKLGLYNIQTITKGDENSNMQRKDYKIDHKNKWTKCKVDWEEVKNIYIQSAVQPIENKDLPENIYKAWIKSKDIWEFYSNFKIK